MPNNIHRGRIQAQGNGVEKSENWSQDDPLTAIQGLTLLNDLSQQLTKQELEDREYGLRKAEIFIENAAENGGVNTLMKKTFKTPKTKDTRIDIEVLGGTAFIQ